MTWRIVSAVFDGRPPHVYLRDADNLPIHLLVTVQGGQVHLFVGHDDRERCPIYLRVQGSTAGTKVSVVRLESWTVEERRIATHVLASLGVSEEERRRVLGWLNGVERATVPDLDGRYTGGGRKRATVADDPSQWPRNLSDSDLVVAYDDRRHQSRMKRELLEVEVRRRGTTTPGPSICKRESIGKVSNPEVIVMTRRKDGSDDGP